MTIICLVFREVISFAMLLVFFLVHVTVGAAAVALLFICVFLAPRSLKSFVPFIHFVFHLDAHTIVRTHSHTLLCGALLKGNLLVLLCVLDIRFEK